MAQTQLAFQSENISFNKSLSSSLKGKTFSTISHYLGENEFTIRGAIPKLLPALCSFLDSNEPNSRDLSKISALITHYRESLGNFNLNNIEANSLSSLTDIGTNDLTELYGTKLSALLDNISLVSGLKEESVFTLLALFTPYILKQVGTHLPKGTGFTPALVTLIDDNKETFQDLIREAKPTLNASSLNRKENSNLFPYFIIISLSAFFIFNGLFYISKKPEKYKAIVEKVITSTTNFESIVKDKLGLRKLKKNVVNTISEPSSRSDLKDSKETNLELIPSEKPIELKFDPSTLESKDGKEGSPSKPRLEQELDSFLREESGINLRIFLLDKVKFGFGISTLTEEAIEQLLSIVPLLKRIEDLHIEIAGHTDNTGEEETNKKISKERADAVASILIQNGIAPANIHTVGYGSSRPTATNSTLEGRYLNRRIELLLAKKL